MEEIGGTCASQGSATKRWTNTNDGDGVRVSRITGMASEAEVIPIFRDLFALRERLESEDVRLHLQDFQKKLKAVILN